MSNVIKRTTLLVRNMETARRWYEQVLEMSAYYDDEVVLSGVGMAAGKEGDRTHLVILRAEDPEIGMIGLLQWVDPVWEAPEISYEVGYGNPVFVAAVDDAEEAYEKAKAAGCKIRGALSEATYPAAKGGTVTVRSVGVFDPDGHFFELNQTLS